jgi:RND family efflux transporter MFP subunit
MNTPNLLLRGLAAALLAVTLSACNEKKAAETAKPERPVLVQAAKFESRVPSRTFVGTIRPRIETDLAFRVTGKVDKRLVQVGDHVVADQVLARLDSIDLGLQKDQAEAELKAALGSQKQASGEFQRMATLKAQGWVTVSELDRQRAANDEADGRVRKAQQAVALAGNALAYSDLRADSEGVVIASLIDPGLVIAAGTPAFRLARLGGKESGDKEVVIALPESMLDRAKTANASATLWTDAGKPYQAKLRELSPSADPATRTYLARFTLHDAGPEVEFGMTATVTLSDAASDRIVRLPLSALFNDGSGPSLWIVDPNTGALGLKRIVVAGYDARDVLVTSGVLDGDLVVTLGVQKLDAGQKVRVVSTLS